ncbi:MAG: hypothetical protein ACYDAR_01440 [Thermomicrobiales bacterium]
MVEHEKQALTPEEFLARKGDAANGRKSPCSNPTESESVHAAHHITTSSNGSRPAANGAHAAGNVTPHA